jgi:hypothetical protein
MGTPEPPTRFPRTKTVDRTGGSLISIRRKVGGAPPRFPRFPENRQLLHFLFQLPNPLLQELPLWFLLGQRQSLLIRRPSLSGPAEPAVHICTGGMCQVIIGQFAMFQHRVDMRQIGLWTIAFCNCHGRGAPILALFEKACPVLPKPRAKPRGIAEGGPLPNCRHLTLRRPRASSQTFHHIFLVRQSQTRNRNGARILRECNIENYVRLQRRTHHPPQNHLRRAL